MRRWGYAIALLLGVAGRAEAADVLYAGHFQITSTLAGATCPESEPVGMKSTARLKPAIAGTSNPPNATLTLFNDHQARGIRAAAGNFGTAFQTVETIFLFANFGPQNGPAPMAVKFATQEPPTILATTKFIEVTGVIRGWDNETGCNVNFVLALHKS